MDVFEGGDGRESRVSVGARTDVLRYARKISRHTFFLREIIHSYAYKIIINNNFCIVPETLTGKGATKASRRPATEGGQASLGIHTREKIKYFEADFICFLNFVRKKFFCTYVIICSRDVNGEWGDGSEARASDAGRRPALQKRKSPLPARRRSKKENL